MGAEHTDGWEPGEGLSAALVACLEALEGGGPVDRQQLLARYPQHAAELARFLDDQERVDRCAAPLRAAVQGGPLPGQPPGPATLGDFRILREVGRGGMGVVYEAEQVSLKRRVALKVLPFAATMDPRQLQRFHNEAQAAACLHHQHIVPVHAVGSDRGVHFYAMQFIEGRPLSDLVQQLRRAEQDKVPAGPRTEGAAASEERTTPYVAGPGEGAPAPVTVRASADETPLTGGGRRGREYYRRVAELGVQAAEALDHAHQLGIVHRDVKPANLLLDSGGRLWVTDFGLAQVQQGEASLTRTGDLVGTLRYMSPEQALAKRVPIDHRTDVYSLGATLYELLTLQPAFAGADRQELLRQIAFEEPAPPRRLRKEVPAELETVVLKALEKNPADRYATARELADDLRRFLEDRPIQARRPTLAQRAMKWSRRHRTVVRGAAVVLLLALAGLAISTFLIAAAYRAATEQRRTAQQERDAAQRRLYITKVQLAQQAWERADLARLRELLDELVPQPGQADLRGWEWSYLDALCHRDRLTAGGRSTSYQHCVLCAAWSPDGTLLATAGGEGEEGRLLYGDRPAAVKVWDVRTGRQLLDLPGQTHSVRQLAWCPDGGLLASLSGKGQVLVWETATGKATFTRKERKAEDPDGQVTWLAWAPAGRRLATATMFGSLKVWDVMTGKADLALPEPPEGARWVGWSSDGRHLAVAGGRQFAVAGGDWLAVWDTRTGRKAFSLNEPALQIGSLNALAWDPSGARLAVGLSSGLVLLCGGTGQQKSRTLLGHTDAVSAVAWSPDGRLATAGWDRVIRVWDGATGQEVGALRGHTDNISSLAWDPRGHRLASAGNERTIRVWDVRAGEQVVALRGHTHSVASVAWNPDDRLLASVSADRTAKVWDTAADQEGITHQLPNVYAAALAWRPDGRQLALPGPEGKVLLLEAATGRRARSLAGHPGGSFAVAWSPDGSLVASGGKDKAVRLWDAATGREVRTLSGHTAGVGGLAFAGDGSRLASASPKEVKVWDVATGREVLSLPEGQGCVTFSPDGKVLATAAADGAVSLWDAGTGKKVRSLLPGPRRPDLVRGRRFQDFGASVTMRVAWGPDGRWLAAVDLDQRVTVWEVATGNEVLSFTGWKEREYERPGVRTREGGTALGWSPDGQRLAWAGLDGVVRLWDVAARVEVFALHGMPDPGQALAWSPDGRHLAAVTGVPLGGWTARVRIWHTGQVADWPGSPPAADGQEGLAASDNSVAWFLATCSEPQFRDPARAVQLARRAVERAPRQGDYWNTLGVAHYRAGNWKDARDALARAGQLRPPSSEDYFFLAMACWHLGDSEQARRWYDKAVAWMARNKPRDEELRRFRIEAATLLGIQDNPESKDTGRQALEWLRADLAAYRRLLDQEPDKACPLVREQMRRWQQDTDFAGVHGPDALARLPEAERQDWQKL